MSFVRVILLAIVLVACHSGSDTDCKVGDWCGNDCLDQSDACWACGELRYDADCECRPYASTCFRPDCSDPTPAAEGEYCGTYWWCERPCAEGLVCALKPDRPPATYLTTCQLP
jgi:hypothetical protein